MFPTDAEVEELGLLPLPSGVQTMLRDERAPPRLVAHLVLVHDVAVRSLRRLREKRGVPASMARFARTHGAPDLTGLALEDVLVAVADTAWKGKRHRELDDAVALAVAGATGAAAWEVFMQLDEILSTLGADADARLAWQGRFPVSADRAPLSRFSRRGAQGHVLAKGPPRAENFQPEGTT